MKVDHLHKFKRAVKERTMVFIDVANLEQSVKQMWVNPRDIPGWFKTYRPNQLCWRVDYRKLKKFFKRSCGLRRIHFYSPSFNTINHRKFLAFIENIGFDLTTKPLKIYADHSESNPHRKANFDVEITADAVKSLNGYDTFILFSGDCDFEYLLRVLSEKGKTCLVFSTRGHVAKELLKISDYYFDLVYFRKQFLKIRIR